MPDTGGMGQGEGCYGRPRWTTDGRDGGWPCPGHHCLKDGLGKKPEERGKEVDDIRPWPCTTERDQEKQDMAHGEGDISSGR